MPLGKKHRYLYQSLWDLAANWRHTRGTAKRILAVRDIDERPNFYREFLAYMMREFPEVRARFELKDVRTPIRHWDRYVLCTPWVQDPVKERRYPVYQKLKALERECASRGIRVLNRADTLSNSVKSTAARVIAGAGCRAARVLEVSRETMQGVGEELGYPLFIRENCQHQGPMLLLAAPEERERIPWRTFQHPVAVEFIDTIGRDGLYRKYRSITCAGFRAPLHLMVSSHWEVRQRVEVVNQATIREESRYCSSNERHADQLEAARRALGFDFCAFDYSLDGDERLVIWEANPYPYLPLLQDRARHRYAAMSRALGVMAAGYLQTAGLDIPDKLLRLVGRE